MYEIKPLPPAAMGRKKHPDLPIEGLTPGHYFLVPHADAGDGTYLRTRVHLVSTRLGYKCSVNKTEDGFVVSRTA